MPPELESSGEKARIRRAFGEAAHSYDAVATLQREVATALTEIVATTHTGICLDVGAGTGFGSTLLTMHCPAAQVVAIDFAEKMCRTIAQTSICGDIESLPLQRACAVLYFSSLAWQWTNASLSAAEAARVLRSGGQLCVATMGQESLRELKSAFAEIDDLPHVRRFEATERLVCALAEVGFKDIQYWRRTHTDYQPSVATIVRGLRELGADTVDRGPQKSFLGKKGLTSLIDAYERHRTPQGLPVTYDVVYLTATKP